MIFLFSLSLSLSYQFVPTWYLSLCLSLSANRTWLKASKACSLLLIANAINNRGFPWSVKPWVLSLMPTQTHGGPPYSTFHLKLFPSLSLLSLSLSGLAFEGETKWRLDLCYWRGVMWVVLRWYHLHHLILNSVSWDLGHNLLQGLPGISWVLFECSNFDGYKTHICWIYF